MADIPILGPNKREQILDRLQELMGESYISARTIKRNLGLVHADARPAIAILDGDEQRNVPQITPRRGYMVPMIITMRPQVFILPEVRPPPDDESNPLNVGQIVNEFRELIVRVVAQDPALQELVSPNGDIAYLGMETDLKSGMRLDGQARLDFAFSYPFDPT